MQWPLSGPFIDPEPLRACCRESAFAPGAVLRTKGLLSIDMYLLTDGEVEVSVERNGQANAIAYARRGAPIGEIGFLTGVPATATVTAKTASRALYIDDPTWREIERREPALAVELYRKLADVAEGRQSYNLRFLATGETRQPDVTSKIMLCRTPEQLLEAQRIRYEVYCEELGRTSPFADAEKKVIADDLDATGHVLLALEDEAPIATLRMNLARHGPLGLLGELYGMAQSPHHPQGTAIVTKFIVRKDHRVGPSSFRLMTTALEMAQRYDIRECFMDCVPDLLPFFASLGFVQSGPPFLHRENGCSYPLVLDIERHAKKVARLAGLVLR
jgi:predicted GNAT family N-acyltransferase